MKTLKPNSLDAAPVVIEKGTIKGVKADLVKGEITLTVTLSLDEAIGAALAAVADTGESVQVGITLAKNANA